MRNSVFFLILYFLTNSCLQGRTSSVHFSQLVEFEGLPLHKKRMIVYALTLAKEGYPYIYGKCSPKDGGFDCSGAVFHTLKAGGIEKVPRTASAQYSWVWKMSRFYAVNSCNENTFELSRIEPCDLLFWSGTYNINRDPPITHVMIYLGRLKGSGKRIMVGGSNGRSYKGKQQNGYSIFDFRIPKPKKGNSSRFLGYGAIPGFKKFILPKYEGNN